MAGVGAPKGNTNRLGRPLKRNSIIEKKLDAMGCNPIEGMARIALECEQGFYNKLSELVAAGDIDEIQMKIVPLLKDLDLAGKMYKELAQYVAAKKRAIVVEDDKGAALPISRIQLVAVAPKDDKS